MAHGIARWSLVSVILLLVGPAALAQTAPTAAQPVPWAQGARFRMDCGQDLHRFCHGLQPGAGRLIQCLSSHRSELSPACMSRLAATRPTLGVVSPSQNAQSPGLPSANPPTGAAVTASALRASCGPDVQMFCAGFSRETGGVIKCLSSHRMKLSPTCDAFFKEMLIRRAAQKGAPKTTPPTANGPAAPPTTANGAADTAAPSAAGGATDTDAVSATTGLTAAPAAASGSTDTGAPSAANGSTNTAVPSLANGAAETPAPAAATADTAAPSAANGPAATPAAANGAAAPGGPSAANGPAATPEAANVAAETLVPPVANGPSTTSALPAPNAATGAAPAAAKKPPARGR
jgi:hypothetical protein